MKKKHVHHKERLSKQSYWGGLYREPFATDSRYKRLWNSVQRLYDCMWGAPNVFGRTYAAYLLDELVLEPHFPHRSDWKVLEVGSAPGRCLVRFHEKFGYEPYGVEYTEEGINTNRRLFVDHGLDPENVIQADFLSDDFLSEFADVFDVVYSSGFIEHFSDPHDIVRRHLAVLREGGMLLIQIPNFRGVNYWLMRVLHPEYVPMHNFSIMDMGRFRALFTGLPLKVIHCGYLGTFSFGLLNKDPGSWKRHLVSAGLLWSGWLGLGLRRWPGRRHVEGGWCSPYLVFVGVKGKTE